MIVGRLRGISLFLVVVLSWGSSTVAQINDNHETIVNFNMDTDPGWTAEGQWQYGQPLGIGGDPTSGYTGENVYGYNLAGQYPNRMPLYWLTTSAIDCTYHTNVVLNFQRWLGVESASFDHAYIEASNDGSSWTRIWSSSYIRDTSWQDVSYDISAVADRQGEVYIRWGMGPTDGSVTFCGWNIDDVFLTGTLIQLGVVTIDLPEGAFESDGVLTGMVSVSSPPDFDLQVDLISDDSTEITVPTNAVIIPAGTTSAVFNAVVQDDYEKDGHKTVSIEASTLLYGSATHEITIYNDDGGILSLQIPGIALESDGIVTGMVTLSEIPFTSLNIQLSSNDPSEVSPAASLVVSPGQTNAAFNIAIQDDLLQDGVQRATITAAAHKYTSGVAEMMVLDDDAAALALVLPNLITENAGTVSGNLLVSPPPSQNITVELASDNPAKLEGTNVLVAAGQNSVPVSLRVFDNQVADGIQTATITVQAPGYAPGTSAVFIEDNETKQLYLNLPDGVFEGQGTLTNAAMVHLDGIAMYDLNIFLESSDATEVRVPLTVTIPAGQSNALFSITAVDDAEVDGRQYPVITASVPGYESESSPMGIGDNEFGGFIMSALDGNIPANTPVMAAIRAANIDGEPVPSAFSGSVSLSAVVSSNTVSMEPSAPVELVNGEWLGVVSIDGIGEDAQLLIDDGDGHTGSMAINLYQLNVVKMEADYGLPYIYLLHTATSSRAASKLLWYNTDSDAIEVSHSAGFNASDLAVHYVDHRIYASAMGSPIVAVFDRTAKTEEDDLVLHEHIYRIGSGPSGLVVSEDNGIGNAYYARMHLWDNQTGSHIQQTAQYTTGRGTGESDTTGRYYYHADGTVYPYTGYLRKYDMSSGRLVQVANVNAPKSARRELIISGDGSHLFWKGSAYDSDLNLLSELGQEIYASSVHGELALTQTEVLNGVSGAPVYALPFSADAMAFSGDQSQLLLFDPAIYRLTSIAMTNIISDPLPDMIPSPAVGGVEPVSLPELSWSGTPLAFAYDVYLGTDSNAVANADTNSTAYFGRQTNTRFALSEGLLSGSETYYWRIDPIGYENSIVQGDLWYFHTPSIVTIPSELEIPVILAAYTQSVSIAVDSAVGVPAPWTADSSSSWLTLEQTSGTAPSTLNLYIDATQLNEGTYSSSIQFNDGSRSFSVPVSVEVQQMRIVKMATDWAQPYIYMAHTSPSAPNRSMLIWYNTDTDTIEQVLDAGENATDLTVHYGDNRIYVSNWKRDETRVFDRTSKEELAPLLLGRDVYKINAGRAGRVYTEEEDQWIEVYARDTATGAIVGQQHEREGDGDCTLDGRYYYHTDNNSSGARLSRFAVTNDTFSGQISVRTKNYYGSRNVFVSMDGNRVYNCKWVYDGDLNELLNIGSEIYAASAYGDMVLTSTKAYNGVSGEEVYTLPFTSTVMAFSADQSSLVLFNSTDGTLTSLNTADIMPVPEPGMVPNPANGGVVGANLSDLSWSGAPAAIAYDVYLGTDSNAVASAGTGDTQYLGRRTTTDIPLPDGLLSGNQTYYWRVDIVAFGNTVVAGEVWDFRTASIAVDPYELHVAGMTADYTQTVSVAVNSTVGAPVSWIASCTNNWVLLGASRGTASGTLDIGFDMSALSAGTHTAEIRLYDFNVVLSVNVTLEVESMRIVKMATDWTLPYIYMAHTSSSAPNKSRLIWYNTDTDTIEQVLDAGENVTDLTVHYGDNRIYVSNWKRDETRVFDRTSKEELAPLLLGRDVYKINAGRAGRVYTEEEDQWIEVYARDTATGEKVGQQHEREGDGDCSLDGRYYYHTDNNSSGARLSRFDVSGDSFAGEISTRTKYYYGSRNVFVSGDGQRVFNCGAVYRTSDLREVINLGTELYAATFYGRYAVSATELLDTDANAAVLTLPCSGAVSAFSGDQSKLVLYNSVDQSVVVQPLGAVPDLGMPGLYPLIADGSAVTFNLDELQWTRVPFATSYNIFFGEDEGQVAAATTGSPEYIGSSESNQRQLPPDTLVPGLTYWWRVDAMGPDGVLASKVWSFSVAAMAFQPSSVNMVCFNIDGLTNATLEIDNRGGSDNWSIDSTPTWLSVAAASGTGDSTVSLSVDKAAQAMGWNEGVLSISSGGILFDVPITVRRLNETVKCFSAAADGTIYASSYESGHDQSYLLEIDTDPLVAQRVIELPENITDMDIDPSGLHLYAISFKDGSLAKVNLNTFDIVDVKLVPGTAKHSSATHFNLTVGTNDVVYYLDGSWAPVAHVFDFEAGVDRSTFNNGGNGLGGLLYDDARNKVYSWRQYGWSAGNLNSWVYTLDVSGNQLVKVDTSAEQRRDPLNSPLLLVDGGNSLINKKRRFNVTNLAQVEATYSQDIYSATPDGLLAIGKSQIFDASDGTALGTLPVSSTIQVCLADSSAIVWYDSSAKTISSSSFADLGITMAAPEASAFMTWKAQYFPDSDMSEQADDDADGLCNLDEYIAGTDPTSADSYFAMHDAMTLPDGRMVIYWDSVTGRVYSIYWTPSLAAPFQLLDSDIYYPQNSYTDQVDRVEQSGFYKMEVELQ